MLLSCHLGLRAAEGSQRSGLRAVVDCISCISNLERSCDRVQILVTASGDGGLSLLRTCNLPSGDGRLCHLCTWPSGGGDVLCSRVKADSFVVHAIVIVGRAWRRVGLLSGTVAPVMCLIMWLALGILPVMQGGFD